MPTALSILLSLSPKRTVDTPLDASLLQFLHTLGDPAAYKADVLALQQLRSAVAQQQHADSSQQSAADRREQLARSEGALGRARTRAAWRRATQGRKASSPAAPRRRYLRCLASLCTRFPILDGEGTGIPSFTWHDAFHPGRATTQQSFHLERAGCMFNLAVAMCQQALGTNRSTAEGSRAASVFFQVRARCIPRSHCRALPAHAAPVALHTEPAGSAANTHTTLPRLQEAAGVFSALREGEATKIAAPQPEDTSPTCLAVLEKLMLVQVCARVWCATQPCTSCHTCTRASLPRGCLHSALCALPAGLAV